MAHKPKREWRKHNIRREVDERKRDLDFESRRRPVYSSDIDWEEEDVYYYDDGEDDFPGRTSVVLGPANSPWR